jgi:hypothetical protein
MVILLCMSAIEDVPKAGHVHVGVEGRRADQAVAKEGLDVTEMGAAATGTGAIDQFR